jgi:hypothetical protein
VAVKPLYKKGDKSNMTNYGPISSLSVFSKVFEKAMYNRLSQHLHTDNKLVTEQHGFQKAMSTEIAAFRQTDNVLKSVNYKLHIRGILCELAKAFDCMSHEILLANNVSMEFKYYLKSGSGPI